MFTRIVLTIFLCLPLIAADIPWPDHRYKHTAEDQELTELLRTFCAEMGIVPVIHEDVTGKVSGGFDNEPGVILDQLATAYSLIYYYDGSALYICPAADLRSEVLVLRQLSVARLEMALKLVGIADGRYPLRTLPEEGVVYVSGPPRYTELVVATAEAMDENAIMKKASQGTRDVIEVFELKYAWAEDQIFNFMDREMVVPGVATVLRNLLTGAQGANTISRREERTLDHTVPKLKGKGLNPMEPEAEAASEDSQGRAVVEDAYLPVITADTRRNALVLRGRAQDMPLYKTLIQRLDVAPAVIEIQASIIDVSTDFSRDLGVDWQYEHEGHWSGGFNTNGDLLYENQPFPTGNGLVFTTIIGDAMEAFIGRVRLLEETGDAKLLSRPSVLTLDNVEAQLEHTRTFYIRVAGDREVDLFNVSAGVTMKVTPHVIEENGKTRIKMAIKIEDGNVLDVSVDNIPVVQRTGINTQGLINAGESLLIGGYLNEADSSSLQKVPVLGNIPLLKALFSRKRKGKTKTERLFLLTPRIVRSSEYHPYDIAPLNIEPQQTDDSED